MTLASAPIPDDLGREFLAGAIAALRKRATAQRELAASADRGGPAAVAARLGRQLETIADEFERGDG